MARIRAPHLHSRVMMRLCCAVIGLHVMGCTSTGSPGARGDGAFQMVDYADLPKSYRKSTLAGAFAYGLYDMESITRPEAGRPSRLIEFDSRSAYRAMSDVNDEIWDEWQASLDDCEQDATDQAAGDGWGEDEVIVVTAVRREEGMGREPDLSLSDYENESCSDERVPLGMQARYMPSSLRPDDPGRLEGQLTDILSVVRRQLMEEAGGARLDLPEIKVTVGGSGLNVTARRNVPVLEVSPELLRDVFIRSAARAVAIMHQEDIFDDITEMTDYDGGYLISEVPPTAPRYMALLANLGGFLYPYYPVGEIATPLEEILNADRVTDEETRKDLLRLYTVVSCQLRRRDPYDDEKQCVGPESDVGMVVGDYYEEDMMSVLATAQEAMLLYAPDAERDESFREYLNALEVVTRRLSRGDDDFQDEAFSWLGLFTEMTLTSQAVNAEMRKSMLFLLSHEAYHIWFDDLPLKSTELAADAFATRAYILAFPEIDTETFFEEPIDSPAFTTPVMSSDMSANENDGFLSLFTGRRPDEVFADTYRGTRYERGTRVHPPFEERMSVVRSAIIADQQEQATNARNKLREGMECLLSAEDDDDVLNCQEYYSLSSWPDLEEVSPAR